MGYTLLQYENQHYVKCPFCNGRIKVPGSTVKNACCIGFTCECKRWLTVVMDPLRCLSCVSKSCSNMVVVE
jgi:hypothetical protein